MPRPLRSSWLRVAAAAGAVAALLALAPAAGAQDATLLRYKWSKQEVFRQRVTMESTSLTTGGGPLAGMKMTQTQVLTSRMTVLELQPDGAAKVETVMESIKLDLDQPMGGKLSYDSTRPEAAKDLDNPMLKVMVAMLKEPFTIVIAPDGSVRDVQGFEKIMEKVASAVEAQGQGAAAAMLKKMLGPDSIKQMMGSNAKLLPAKAVKPGETWRNATEMEMPMLGTMKQASVSTFKGLETRDGVAVAKIQTALQISVEPGKDSSSLPPGFAMKMKEGTGTGEAWFDPARGRLLKGITKMSHTIETSVGQGPQAMQMQQASTATVTVEDLGAAGKQ